MKNFLGNHCVAVMAVIGMATGFGGGGHALYQIAQFEHHHVQVQARGGNHGHQRGER